MDERKENNLTVIENKLLEKEEEIVVTKTVNNATNPITRKFLEFQQERLSSKFSVKDLFKK